MAAKPSPVVLDKLVGDLADSDPEFSKNVIFITNFFDTVQSCLKAGECSKAVAEVLLLPHALDFCELYGGYVATYRDRVALGRTGSGLAKLAAMNEGSRCRLKQILDAPNN